MKFDPSRPPVCCPCCRLLQHARVCVDCGADTAALGKLLQVRIEGLTTVSKRPATGWRDTLALLGTAFGIFAAGTAGVLISHSPAGLLLAPAVGIFGYTKQYWRSAFKRRPRLAAVPPRSRPAGEPLIGTAQPFEQTVRSGALAVATTIESRRGVIVRAVDAVPFWLALPGRRVLVTGDYWVAGTASERDNAVSVALGELEAAELPIATVSTRRLQVLRVMLMPGDRVAVSGRAREEQLPGAGGYRDALVETIRGESGSPVWIDRLDAQ
ncbi:MAG: hypothetical protein E6J90_33860 [Deltaproteobacteria bacterium]|nr:MAG: hypothetical protein E6J90_33860 [Deltaproteobacteria bacterium]TMQ13752.1 MAG: hypothetical protein E6J91_17545 [Deltaproteobacteria bacterium]